MRSSPAKPRSCRVARGLMVLLDGLSLNQACSHYLVQLNRLHKASWTCRVQIVLVRQLGKVSRQVRGLIETVALPLGKVACSLTLPVFVSIKYGCCAGWACPPAPVSRCFCYSQVVKSSSGADAKTLLASFPVRSSSIARDPKALIAIAFYSLL
jgi:hypothetical protein